MRLAALALFLASSLVVGCGGGDGNEAARNQAAVPAHRSPEGRGTLGDHLAGAAEHRRFVELLRGSALIETLNGAGVYTVFAPTDSAFAALSEPVQTRLAAPEQRERLITLLSFHIVPGTVTAEDLERAIEQAPG